MVLSMDKPDFYTFCRLYTTPGIVLVHLVTALTLNTAWGWYTISTTFSVSIVCDSRVSLRLPVISVSLTKNEYGTLSSFRNQNNEVDVNKYM